MNERDFINPNSIDFVSKKLHRILYTQDGRFRYVSEEDLYYLFRKHLHQEDFNLAIEYLLSVGYIEIYVEEEKVILLSNIQYVQ